jgi:hypothetical protein
MGRASAGTENVAGTGVAAGDPGFGDIDVHPAANSIPAKMIRIRIFFMIAPFSYTLWSTCFFFTMNKKGAEVKKVSGPFFGNMIGGDRELIPIRGPEEEAVRDKVTFYKDPDAWLRHPDLIDQFPE